MPRKRYQKGSLLMKGSREKVWYGRWLEDQVINGQLVRVHRSVRLGSVTELTRTQAQQGMQREMAMACNDNNQPVQVGMSYQQPSVPLKPAVTFADFAKKWQDMILLTHKPSSRNSEKSHCARLTQHFGACNMREIGTEQLQAFVSGLNGTGENLKPKTIHNIAKTMSILWATAKRWGYVERNPIEDLSLPRLDAVQVPCYTLGQVKRIIAAADEPYKTLFWIVAETGICGGEVCGLCVSDISFDTGTILVQRSAWRGHLQSPKTDAAVRCFPISKELLDHIGGYLESKWRANPNRLLFCSVNGNALDNAEVVKKILHPLTDRLQLPRGGLHALRHMNATELDRLNVPVAVRRERLGHAQFTTTLRYTHAMSDDHRRVADQLGKLLGQELLP